MEPVTLSYTLTQSQVVRFQRDYIWWIWIRRPMSLTLFALLALLIAWVVFDSRESGLRFEHQLVIALPVGVVLGLLIAPWFRARRQYRSSPTLRGPQKITIREDAIRIEAVGATGEIEWTSHHRIRRLPSGWYVMISDANGNLIPHSAIPEADRERLEAFFRERDRA